VALLSAFVYASSLCGCAPDETNIAVLPMGDKAGNGSIAADLFDEVDARDSSEDREDGINCGAIRREIIAERTVEERQRIREQLAQLRRELLHRHVSRRQLVAMMRPWPGEGRPSDPMDAAAQDLWLGHLLCDPLTREIQTRHFLARHPEYALGSRGGR
jgi:hypothetical protein